jgi:TP901 family phage tail tape measure protein
LVKAGLSVGDVLNGAADATVALAAAGEISLPEAATIASNAMNQFGLSAKELPKVADLIAGAANTSAIDVSDFGHSLSQVGAVAHLTGQTIGDTATAIALLGNAGIKGSDAGTSLKTFLSNLVPTTKTATAAMKELGIITKDGSNKFLDAKGNYKSLADIAGVLNTSLKGMSESQKQAALQTIFGSDAVRAAAVIAGQGKKGFDDLAKSMNSMKAADVAATRLNNTAGSIEQLKGSLETVGIQIGQIFLPAINNIIKTVGGWVNAFAGLNDSTKQTIVTIVGIVGGLALFGAGVIKVVKFMQALNAALKFLKVYEIVIKAIQLATKIWTAVQWALDAALSANPIGLVIAAIVALIGIFVLLFNKNKGFHDFVIAVWQGIVAGIKAAVDWIVTYVWPVIQAVWNAIVEGAKWLWGWITKIFGFIVDAIKFYVGILVAVWNTIAPVVKAVFDLVVSVIQTAWSIISAIFQVWWALFSNTVIPMFKFLWDAVVWAFNGIMDIVKTVWGWIGPYVIAAVKLVWDAIVTAWNAIVTVTTTVWNWVKNAILTVWNFLAPYVIAAVKTVWDFLVQAWNNIKVTTNAVWNGIKTFFSSLWDSIKSIFTNAISAVTGIINNIKKVVDSVKQWFDGLKNAASGGIGSLIDYVKKVPGQIISALGNLGSMLYNSGKKIIQGLIDGIGSMFGALKQKVEDGLSKIRNLLPFSPAKEGPFSGKGWTMYSGMAMVGDLAKGITRGAHMPVDAMMGALSGVSTTIGFTAPSAATSASNASVIASGSPVNVGVVQVNGVWDFTDPASTRTMVANLNTALDNYKREYK